MKKAAFITIAILIFLVGMLLLIPMIFRDTLLEKTKSTINNQINAKVDFSDLNISLIRNFPKVTLELKNVLVSGIDQFKTDTLIAVPSFRTRFSFISLLKKEGFAIEEISLKNPLVNLIVDSLGNANWNIAKQTTTVQNTDRISDETDKVNGQFEIQLRRIAISDAAILYKDISMPMLLSFKESQINLKGKMYGSSTDLTAEITIGRFLLNYDSTTYISNTSLKTNSVFSIDFNIPAIQIKEGNWWINKLPVDLAGEIKMPGDSMLFNLSFKALRTNLAEFLALVPPDYEKYLESVETEGTAAMSGFFKGLYLDEEYPAFSFDFAVGNGRINYPDLPEEIRNISTAIRFWKPQGKLDLMALSVANTHLEIGGNPVDLSVSLSNIYSDLNFDCGLKGKFNFGQLKKALPLANMPLEGHIDADIAMKGVYSDVDQKQYDRIKADGKIVLTGLSYSGREFAQPVKIPSGTLHFTPADIIIPDLNIAVGESDLAISGTISNYLRYFLSDGILSGSIRLISEKLNLNELLTLQTVTSDSLAVQEKADSTLVQPGTDEFSPIRIPPNYDLSLTAEIGTTNYEKLQLRTIKAAAGLKEGRITLSSLTMNLPEGDVRLDGMFGNAGYKFPLFNINGNIRSVDIASVYNSLPSLDETIPEAARAGGKFDASFKVKGELGRDVTLTSLEGSANLSGFTYSDPELSKTVTIPTGRVDFTSDQVSLSQLKVLIGSSDMTLTGNVKNYLDYYHDKGTLEGELQLTSGFLNADELMNLQVDPTKQEAAKVNTGVTTTGPPADKETKAFKVPDNLNLAFSTSISKASYNRIPVTDINGKATIKDGILNLQGLNMKMLEGEFKLNGMFAGNTEGRPEVDLGFAIENFDIPAAFNSMKLFQEKIPISGQSQGKFSTSFSMKGRLTPEMKPDFPSVSGNGLFNTFNLQIVNSPLFDQLKNILKKERLSNVKLEDIAAQFTIENGNLLLKPFSTKIAGQETKISGNLNAQNLISLRLDFNIQRDVFGPEIQKLLSALPGQENIGFIPATVNITGPVKEPSVKVDLDEARKLIAEEVKKSAAESLKKSLDKIGTGIKKMIEK